MRFVLIKHKINQSNKIFVLYNIYIFTFKQTIWYLLKENKKWLIKNISKIDFLF